MHLKSLNIFLYISFFFNLFVLINPIGMIPVFISMTNCQNSVERKQTNFKVNLTVFFILLSSLLFGSKILNTFGISIHSFKIAGGILITSTAISMITGKLYKKNKKFGRNKKSKIVSREIGVVPLATPLIAGPGVISSIIIWSTQHNNIFSIIICSFVIVIFSYMCWILFNLSNFFIKILGEDGVNITTKIMGLLLMSIGIEFLINEIKFFMLK
ncbi:YchE family NAAT transporter [Buchnera aphidicola (Chaitoregma tattakana)]|uniref:YchE family NAAT transporter n=1 Tax=Buchnera aphidicola TaxID=9 RepID=UPI0031B7FB91